MSRNNDKKVNDELKRVSGSKSSNKSKSKSSSSAFYVENAKTMYEAVKELKKHAGDCGKKDDVQKMLEQLAPTTLLNSKVQCWPPASGWVPSDASYAMEDTFSSPLTPGKRLWISNQNCYKKFTSGRKDGVEGYPIFSTYSKIQREQMKATNKKVRIDPETIRHDLYKFLHDPILNYRLYSNIRNHLWANYMGFCEFDILTRLWHGNKKILKERMYKDDLLTEYVVKCFLNELNIIDDWTFGKPVVDMFGDEEKNIKCIQQMLRGHVTSAFMIITQVPIDRVPPPVEFEFGKFRFPIRGLSKTEPKELCDIYDLSFFSMSVEKGLLSLSGFKQLMFDCIGTRIRSYTDGEAKPSCRIYGDMLVYEYLGESTEGDDYEVSEKIYNYYRKKFNSIENKYGLFGGDLFCYEPDRIANEVGLKSFYKLAEDYRRELSNKVLNFQQYKKNLRDTDLPSPEGVT